MSADSFKEITELTATQFSECHLGRLAQGKIFRRPMSEYDKPLGIICEDLRNCPIDGNNGNWEGERGNSRWIPDRTYIPPHEGRANYKNPDNLTWGEILDKYSIDKISFNDGEPDFSDVKKGTVKIEVFSTSRDDNFDRADIELAKQKGCSPEEVTKWRKDNNCTWHECKNMTTMEKVPHEIHANISHSGGISKLKNGGGE